MKKLPIGMQALSELLQNGYVYVDKTRHIYELITTGKYYFFARPRRFGKSLLISTLAEIFSGNKKLFIGLDISALSYGWKQYPVINISFSDIPCTTPEELEQGIQRYLYSIAQENTIELDKHLLPSQMLQVIVMALSKDNRVVLLVDEYDYPILRHIHDVAMADKMREILKSFYIIIKGLDSHLKFVLLTGVSKFSKTSIFSGLNNLEDISLSATYNDLVGYTKAEITTYFNEHLAHTKDKINISADKLLEKITVWYDGYRFTRNNDSEKLYNPFSVMLCLKNSEFSNYWFATGTPTFLVNLLQSKQYPIQDFDGIEATEGELSQFEVDNIFLKTLLFQTGYLTIQKYNPASRNYLLNFPNKETIDSLGELIFASMTSVSGSILNNVTVALLQAFDDINFEHIRTTLTQLFAAIPYTIQISEEKYYQTIFYLVLKMIGAHVIVEQPTNIGRIDAIIQTQDTCFIIEFKINSTAAKALQQIEDKKYYQPYESLRKKIILVGIVFDTVVKNITEIEYKVH
ncbi:MAG TPA: AAA family ATPase [Candidatus Babeliales bacterium]|nr:AAA family ATPase [Candidatus Babeliales bacterium]